MLQELGDLVDEVRLSFNAFTEFAREAHGHRIDPPGRAVLEYLANNPPSAVPTIARSRGVTRQHIQTIINELAAATLVEGSPNPAHKRSPLFALTPQGKALIESITRTEGELVQPLRRALAVDRLIAATETLAEVRELITNLEDES